MYTKMKYNAPEIKYELMKQNISFTIYIYINIYLLI